MADINMKLIADFIRALADTQIHHAPTQDDYVLAGPTK